MEIITKINRLTGETFIESINPFKVDYGVDEKIQNKHWKKTNIFGKEVSYTVFGLMSKKYLILIDDEGQIKYNVIEKFPETVEEISDFMNYNRVQTTNIQTLFGSLFYVINKGIQHFNLKEFYFSGHDLGLSKFYDRLVNNTHFKNNLSNVGFELKEKDKQGNLIFIRK